MKKTVLIIDESPLFRDYLQKKLGEYGLDVVKAVNGIDGLAKITNLQPDLIITDYFLSQKDILSLLKAKQTDASTSGIPLIIVSARISREKIQELAHFNVKKFFTKPLKVDLLLGAISEYLDQKIQLDSTPCILEAHMNEDILFIEVARGLNTEKINLLEFKINELLKIYNVEIPKILVMFSNVEMKDSDKSKFEHLLEILAGFTRGRIRWIKILTQSKEIENQIRALWEYNEITVTDSLDRAMDELMEKRPLDSAYQDKIVTSPAQKDVSSVQMRFERDSAFKDLSARFNSEAGDLTIAVVDDDFIVQEIIKNTFSETQCQIMAYDDGKNFIDDLPKDLDLVFLDLMMPNMNGFEVMENMRMKGLQIPVIILSALSRKETVLKAMSFGIKSYITKPIKPDELLKKTFEAVGSHF